MRVLCVLCWDVSVLGVGVWNIKRERERDTCVVVRDATNKSCHHR
jgi:hypothetical protein